MYYFDTQFIGFTGYIGYTVDIHGRTFVLFLLCTIYRRISRTINYMAEITASEILLHGGAVGDIKLCTVDVCSNARVLSLKHFA